MKHDAVEGLWAHLHWLTVLQQQGSFSKAAARLGVSKASMSQHIADLEKATGIALVQRTTRSAKLTEAGKQLVESTRGAFEQIATGFASVRDLAGAPRGSLRVTAPVAFARQQLVPRLPEFLRRYPAIHLELDMSDRIRSLAQEGFDVAVRHTGAPPETHVAWTLTPTRTVLAASRSYLRARGIPETPQALSSHACLHYPRAEGTPTWTFVPARSAPSGPATSHVDPMTVAVAGPMAVNNSEALRDAAIEGLGIALLPDFSAQSALETGRLIEVLPEWRPTGAFGEWLYAIRPYSAHTSRVSQVFIEFLRGAFANGFSTKAPTLI
ncbi:LysR family transcriptional regulator [Pandoraea terrae]|uniref:LysR family transcriptional regulator n=1 Tax=Pandoraea terrae TaxID=1537710 RepID=A0A5E4Z2W7_9BURK|nr:LysR family transcriptional regulator [Pandoraea terrae]VVE54680.1 LysR family transcriptional regulator [Pandoraea terrae]